MEIFLGCETYGIAGNYWYNIHKEYQKFLSKLKNNNYGDELIEINIISIILPGSFYEDDGYKERIIFRKKDRSADIRLRIDYNSFVRAKPKERNIIYKSHILESIKCLKSKLSSNYQFDFLLNDVDKALNIDDIGDYTRFK